jgi:acyl-CoA synthetase (AMP-forming)/AMP-acid ligase II
MVSSSLLEGIEKAPEEEITSAGDRSLTVGEFANRVAAVAAFLWRDDENTPVVMLVDRSVDSDVSLHGGVWSARCVVPLGVDEPKPRLASIIARHGPASCK